MSVLQLKFVITKTNGEKVEQEVPCIPEKVGECIRDMLLQYANLGMIKKDGDKMILLCASQIAYAEVDIPSVVIAGANEVPQKPTGGITLS
jgi:hypothetical protein